MTLIKEAVSEDKLSPVPFTCRLEGKSIRDHCAVGAANPHFCAENLFFFLPTFFPYIKIVIIFIKGNAQLYLHCKTGFKKGKTNTE